MKILICVKQVPDPESRFRPNAEGDWFDDSDLAFKMNEYDEYAVEEAVRLKEKSGGEPDLTVVSVGPRRALEAVKKALAMGADRGIHIEDPAYFRKDPFQIASMLAGAARDRNFDLIFTGMQSQDRGSAQVGVLLAELLGYACATTVVNFEFEGGRCRIRRELEGGIKAAAELKIPAVITCQLGLNVPRYPTLPNIMKARKKEIITIGADGLGATQALSVTEKFYPPARKTAGTVIEGDVNDAAEKLIKILTEKTTVMRK